MIRALVCFALVALSCAEEAEPSTVESTFVGLFGNAQTMMHQSVIQRRFADIMLGLQTAQSFGSYAAIEFAKLNPQQGAGADLGATTLIQERAPRRRASRSEELEENDDDAAALEDMGAEELLELKDEAMPDLEFQSTSAKTTALKSLQMQLFLTSTDVEDNYWVAKITSGALPPQLATFKLYKSYLNTMALSLAFQLHDAYTFEAIVDDFNDRSFGGASGSAVEANAELHVYSHWMSLASIKYQLFLINMYEQSLTFASMPRANANANANANSFLEVEAEVEAEAEAEAEFVGGAANPNALLMQYTSLSYSILMLRYYAIFSELSLAQTGLSVAHIKVTQATSAAADNGNMLAHLEGQALPHLYSQWASTNQMKYNLEYFALMFEMQNPALAFAQALQKAENSFVTMFQSGKPETFPAPAPSTSN